MTSDEITKAMGGTLKALRKRRTLTQQELADRAGFTRTWIAQLEAGHADPPLSTLLKLAKALGVSVAALVGGSR